MPEKQLNEYIINEKITVGTLVERDGVLYRCESCTWLEDSQEALNEKIDNGTEADYPFIGWNALLVERPTSAQTPLGWLWQELSKMLSSEQLTNLRNSFNAHNQVYQKSRTATTRAQQLARVKQQKRNLIASYTAQLNESPDAGRAKFLKSEIAKAQAYLEQRGEQV